jgi:hypothetical protein
MHRFPGLVLSLLAAVFLAPAEGTALAEEPADSIQAVIVSQLVDWAEQRSPIWDSHLVWRVRFSGMRTGISFTVSAEDRTRLESQFALSERNQNAFLSPKRQLTERPLSNRPPRSRRRPWLKTQSRPSQIRLLARYS